MTSVDDALGRVWPAELRTDRLHLRPVTAEDASLVRELLTDAEVRAYLGGPASQERVAARQAAYPATAGAWTVVRVADDQTVGLVTIGPDHRCEGRGGAHSQQQAQGRRAQGERQSSHGAGVKRFAPRRARAPLA
ncbi:GNAT family N-acetyltransferase [Streptomyces sp. ISL-11]|uniref:GNAT family N-acetyltransferase n=1 Tax=Streptomyces sp. ISL-11 TaxID=2819174 RepID=UPI001BEB8ADB|nr:GNAT family N-acetyltransferase [Streptomyces sp. ISL-11]MBT2384513.1 hypothetical protein [Streptomyces sp. ISL-11]